METLHKNLSSGKDDYPTISTYNFLAYTKPFAQCQSTLDRFCHELALTVANNDGRLCIEHPTCNLKAEMVFAFMPLLECSSIEITRGATSTNKSYFDMILNFSFGVVRLHVKWSVWQDIRTYDLMRGMLVPLFLEQLQDKVTCNGVKFMMDKKETIIPFLFQQAADHIPNQFHPTYSSSDENLAKYAIMLEQADEIGYRGESDFDLPEPMQEEISIIQKAWHWRQVAYLE